MNKIWGLSWARGAELLWKMEITVSKTLCYVGGFGSCLDLGKVARKAHCLAVAELCT